MTKKKNHNDEEYNWDELEIEEQTHRKGGLRRHRARRNDPPTPFDLPEELWRPSDGKGRNNDD